MQYNGYIRIFNKIDKSYRFDFLMSRENFFKEIELFKNYDSSMDLTLLTKIKLKEYTDYYVTIISLNKGHYKLSKVKGIKMKDNQIFKTIDFLNKKEIDYNKKHLFDDLDIDEKSRDSVRVYNVGHGNMNTIHYNNGDILLFDQGSKEHYNISFLDYSNDKVTRIVISHFHEDHYNIMIKNSFVNLKTIVIPNDNIPLKVAFFISNYKHVNIITLPLATSRNINSFNSLFPNHHFFTGPDTRYQNNRGIILNYMFNNKIYSFTGDIMFYLFGRTLTGNINNKLSLVVPHHGGYMGRSRPRINEVIDIAAYSYGNLYNLPYSVTENTINSYRFYIKSTYHLTIGNYRIL